MYFLLFGNNFPFEKGVALHLNKLKSSLPYDVLCQVWLKLAQWIRRRTFFSFVNVFLLFGNYLPLEKDGALYLYKHGTSSPKNAYCQVWLKLAMWFRRRYFNSVNVFLQFGNYPPMGKDGTLHLTKLEPP